MVRTPRVIHLDGDALMMRHLTKLALAGALGVFLLTGDAQACHRNRCGGGCGTQVSCYRPVSHGCGPRAKSCCGGVLFHKRSCGTYAGPVVACNYGYSYGGGYSYGYGAPTPTGQYMGTPQVPGKSMGTPQVPGKSMGTPQR
jgi:hypothetical protein